MARILLIGALNETMKSISDHLMKSFQVDICPENVRNATDMIKIFKPSALVINITEVKGDVVPIFEKLKEKFNTMPLVVIGTKESINEVDVFLESIRKKKVLCRPVRISDVLNACNEVLGIEQGSGHKAASDEKKANILVVDDNALVLRNVKAILDEDYNVSIANNGEKGLEFARTKHPDLILLDYDMPGMDGSQVFAKIKENKELSNIPVIFLTSVSEKNQIMEVMKNRPNGYILKPPAKDKLIEVIKEALN